MAGQIARNRIWKLVESQHGVVARRQLLDLEVHPKTVDRRMALGRLHPLWRGVYAVGRPTVTVHGWWMAAVLACGDGAALSHQSAAALLGIRQMNSGDEGRRARPPIIDVSIPADRVRRLEGIRVHRRRALRARDVTECQAIAVTTPARTLVDLGTVLHPRHLEAAVNAADRLDLIDPDRLRHEIQDLHGMDGGKALRAILDRRTFALTDSDLERRFLRLIRRARMPTPRTQQRVAGYRVDFVWPELRMVVETDGLRYHRTATQQARDRERDQALVAAGFIALRFTHAQVAYEPQYVITTLRTVLKSISKD